MLAPTGASPRWGTFCPCFATRFEIAAAAIPGHLDPDGAPLYPGLYRGLDAATGEPLNMRLNIARALDLAAARLGGRPLTFRELDRRGHIRIIAARPERWGDVVIQRKDTPTSDHLSVVVDNARQSVTPVTRGRDFLPATGLHRLLQVLLDLAQSIYHHHDLLTDDTGRKLSKTARDASIESLRDQGVNPDEIRRRVGC